jgi:FlaA1/EpsC-like NDP-sugar epimerase
MNTNNFLSKFLNRGESMFKEDIDNNASLLYKSINNMNVLVIGGAGTIGSSFIKSILKFNPYKIVVVDLNENGLTELVRDIRSDHEYNVSEEFYTYPMSYASNVFEKMFNFHGPFDIVANFAAHKHVRSEKDIFSIEALIENNILYAKNLLEILLNNPPKHFFCVSTDKAANPVNIMGASKRLMEELILSYSYAFKVTTARFANVAFSNGSLLDGFKKRIDKNQPISCPRDITRFFVTPQESGEICMLSCILGNASEIFYPKLNMKTDLINFTTIIKPLLNEYGFIPEYFESEAEAKKSMFILSEKKYPIYLFDSDTSGEKLYEEFYTEDETINESRFNSLGVIYKKSNYSRLEINKIFDDIKSTLDKRNINKSNIVEILTKYLPDFKHIETGKNLDSKM